VALLWAAGAWRANGRNSAGAGVALVVAFFAGLLIPWWILGAILGASIRALSLSGLGIMAAGMLYGLRLLGTFAVHAVATHLRVQ
jgi:hypothetical protein